MKRGEVIETYAWGIVAIRACMLTITLLPRVFVWRVVSTVRAGNFANGRVLAPN